MITNLFSIFDPSTRINLSLNWLSALILIIFIPSLFWITPNNINFIYIKITKTLYNEYKVIIRNNKNNNFTLIFVSLFIFIILNNFLGLFPYIFTRTSHLTLNLTLALPLWFRLLLYGWVNKTNHILRHLVPQGTPTALIPFIVCIETISNLIRPITLTVRLTANIIAGHLLLTLLGNIGPHLSSYYVPILIFTQILLLTLEAAVAIIQSYVFSILITLYSREI